MPISSRTHACLDLTTAGLALALPRMLGASERTTKLLTAIALGKIGYGLATRHELGLVKTLPMKTHLKLDALSGIALCGLPLVLDKQEKPAVAAAVIGLGLVDIAAASLTETRSILHVQRSRGESQAAGPPPMASPTGLRWATVADTIKLVSLGALPTLAKGAIIRRRSMMAVGEQLDFDSIAVKTVQQARARYGSGPLMLKLPFRNQAVILDPAHMRRVLDESPEPFATAGDAKYAALAHFEPKISLVSRGHDRTVRRQLNEQTLESQQTVHPMAGQFLSIVDEEAASLLDRAGDIGELRWDEFIDAWFTMVRRIVFGNRARGDRRITDLMARLRSDANWVMLKPRRTGLRDELHGRIRQYIDNAEPGSLAAYMARRITSGQQAPEQQICQWLFAFGAAAMATFRGLALLAAHPEQLERARPETTHGIAELQPHRPLLRATVLEALRLWPTTPMILRQTTRDSEWQGGIMPAGTSVLIFTPFFHRDDERLPNANTFDPDLWIDDDPEVRGFPPRRWPFVPFSGGPAHCPGQNVVLLLTSGMLAALIGDRQIRLADPRRLPPGRLPGTQDHFTLRFEVSRPRQWMPATGAAHELLAQSHQRDSMRRR
jgi:cytochrome P450